MTKTSEGLCHCDISVSVSLRRQVFSCKRKKQYYFGYRTTSRMDNSLPADLGLLHLPIDQVLVDIFQLLCQSTSRTKHDLRDFIGVICVNTCEKVIFQFHLYFDLSVHVYNTVLCIRTHLRIKITELESRSSE